VKKPRRLLIDWSDGNEEKLWRSHGITRVQVEEAMWEADRIHEPLPFEDEPRMICFAELRDGFPIAIVYTLRRGKIRPISARKMSKQERKEYAAKRPEKPSAAATIRSAPKVSNRE
jgi:uncharacterized DUF497 family protein